MQQQNLSITKNWSVHYQSGTCLVVHFSLSVGIEFPEKIRGVELICPVSMALGATPKVFYSLEITNPKARAFFSNALSGPFILMKQKSFQRKFSNQNQSLLILTSKGTQNIVEYQANFKLHVQLNSSKRVAKLDCIKIGKFRYTDVFFLQKMTLSQMQRITKLHSVR